MKRSRTTRPVVVALVLLLLLATVPAAAQDLPPFGVQQGQRAPFFVMVGRDGAPTGNRDYLGAPLILNFWATWCGPCRAELPLFQRVADETGVEFLLINLREPPGQIHGYLDELGVNLALARDPDRTEREALQAAGVTTVPSASVFNVYRAFGLPTSYLVDADGVIRRVLVGQVLEDTLAAALAEVGIDWSP